MVYARATLRPYFLLSAFLPRLNGDRTIKYTWRPYYTPIRETSNDRGPALLHGDYNLLFVYTTLHRLGGAWEALRRARNPPRAAKRVARTSSFWGSIGKRERERERFIIDLNLSFQFNLRSLKISLFNCKKFEYENRRSLDANQGNSVKRRIAQGCSISSSLFFFFLNTSAVCIN